MHLTSNITILVNEWNTFETHNYFILIIEVYIETTLLIYEMCILLYYYVNNIFKFKKLLLNMVQNMLIRTAKSS